jgi:hypothetical protein
MASSPPAIGDAIVAAEKSDCATRTSRFFFDVQARARGRARQLDCIAVRYGRPAAALGRVARRELQLPRGQLWRAEGSSCEQRRRRRRRHMLAPALLLGHGSRVCYGRHQ